MTVTHAAGVEIQINDQLRQRCAWCGELLLDYDLTRIAVPDGQDPTPRTWPVGELVAVDGRASWVINHAPGDPLPEDACAVPHP